MNRLLWAGSWFHFEGVGPHPGSERMGTRCLRWWLGCLVVETGACGVCGVCVGVWGERGASWSRTTSTCAVVAVEEVVCVRMSLALSFPSSTSTSWAARQWCRACRRCLALGGPGVSSGKEATAVSTLAAGFDNHSHPLVPNGRPTPHSTHTHTHVHRHKPHHTPIPTTRTRPNAALPAPPGRPPLHQSLLRLPPSLPSPHPPFHQQHPPASRPVLLLHLRERERSNEKGHERERKGETQCPAQHQGT